MVADRLSKYGALNTHDVLKFAAIMLMLVDHVGLYFFPEDLTLRAIGRACVPIWFFFIGAYKPSKFGIEILLYAIFIDFITMVIPEISFGNLNILFSIIIVRLLIGLCEKYELHKKTLLIPVLLAILFYPISVAIFSYGSIGFLFAFMGYLYRVGCEKNRFYAYSFSAMGIFLFLQISAFHFGFFDAVTCVALTSISMLALLRYDLKKIGLKLPKLIEKPVMILARYSLEFYALHLTIFMLIFSWIH